MAASETLARRSVRDGRRGKALPLHSRMIAYGLALRACGALFVASMIMLLSANAVLAHTRGGEAQDEHRLAQFRQFGRFVTTTVTECTVKIVISDAAASIRLRPTEVRATPIGDDSDDLECDDCCGVACHAAVPIASNGIVGLAPPLSMLTPGGPPALMGRSQGPPERPPRVSLRLSSREEAAG
jgi:hypothetical protein